MQQLGVLRVEPVQVEGVGEQQVGHRPRLRDVSRERHVVPERVAAVDAAVEREQGRPGPLNGDDEREGNRDPELPRERRLRVAWPGAGERRLRVRRHQHRLDAKRPCADDHAARGQQHAVKKAEEPEQLRQHDQGAEAKHSGGEQRRRAAPPGEECTAHRAPSHRHRDGHQPQREDREQVRTGAHCCPQAALGSSSPSIRKTETRPERRTSSVAAALRSQPPSGEAVAVAGSFRSSSGVVTT